jgi:hypothetical protein
MRLQLGVWAGQSVLHLLLLLLLHLLGLLSSGRCCSESICDEGRFS